MGTPKTWSKADAAEIERPTPVEPPAPSNTASRSSRNEADAAKRAKDRADAILQHLK